MWVALQHRHNSGAFLYQEDHRSSWPQSKAGPTTAAQGVRRKGACWESKVTIKSSSSLPLSILLKGRGREVARIATHPGFGYNWDLSPDGAQIAMMFPVGENRIRLLPLGGGAPRDLVIRSWYGFSQGPDWAPDGKGFYVASSTPRGSTLLYIDVEGHANAVWEQKGSFATWGVPSPDGRRLAMLGSTVDSNVWMIENF
jgi:Tol biopolymer transport system component